MTTNTQEKIYFAGIEGATGRPAIKPRSIQEIAETIRTAILTKELRDPTNIKELRLRQRKSAQQPLGFSGDPCLITKTGWGIVFAQDADPEAEAALSPLINHRAGQTGEGMCRVFKGEQGVKRAESEKDWLTRNRGGLTEANPKKVPYLLLLVGGPEIISFQFQRHLSLAYAVGRIHFNTLQEYANYAESVVLAETHQQPWLQRKLAFFGSVNGANKATNHLKEKLIEPLSENLRSLLSTDPFLTGGLFGPDAYPEPCEGSAGLVSGWEIETYLAQKATRDQLVNLLGGVEPAPALLFAAGHGYEEENLECKPFKQGALVCSDWNGREGAPVPRNAYLSGDELPDGLKLLGTIAFLFACYGGGTPDLEESSLLPNKISPTSNAEYPFLARLPTKLLGAPTGGAQAVIAQVGRVLSYSYEWPGVGMIHEPFVECLTMLLRGFPIGHALQPFFERHAILAARLSSLVINVSRKKTVDDMELVETWRAANDSGSFVLLGDPAVRVARTVDRNPSVPAFKPITVNGIPKSDSRPNELPDPCREV